MVLLYKKHHLFKKTYVRGQSGGSLLSFVPAVTSLASNAASGILSKIDYSNIIRTLGGLAVGSVASYGMNKALENYSNKNNSETPINVVHNPELTIGAILQGIMGIFFQ